MNNFKYNKEFIIDPHLKEKEVFQVLGEKMMLFFPKKDHNELWSLFYHHSVPMVEASFVICQEKGINNIRYLVAILRNRK